MDEPGHPTCPAAENLIGSKRPEPYVSDPHGRGQRTTTGTRTLLAAVTGGRLPSFGRHRFPPRPF
jgi:hypothetical protein